MGSAGQYQKEDFNIFIVEDDYIYNKLATLITAEITDSYNCPDINFNIHSYTSAQECIQNLDKSPRIIILDYFFEINSTNNISTAVDVLGRLRDHDKNTQIIIVSSLTEIMKIVQLMELGAHHYILKDQDSLNRLRFTVKNIIKDLLEDHYLS
jgi:CheY-like chemotaxis protein